MKATIDPRVTVLDSVELLHDRLLERLRLTPRSGAVALHVTCSATRMGLEPKLRAVAQACAERVVVPPTGCCGFAGDKGFTTPELAASSLRELAAAVKGCERGFSSSRGCEVGLTTHAGIPYQSLVHLVDACSAPLDAPPPLPPLSPSGGEGRVRGRGKTGAAA
jgi:D-lactate dehydrogenase